MFSGSPTQEVMGAVKNAREATLSDDRLDQVRARLQGMGVSEMIYESALPNKDVVQNVVCCSMSFCGLLPCFWPRLCLRKDAEEHKLYFVTGDGFGYAMDQFDGCCSVCSCCADEDTKDFVFHSYDSVTDVSVEEMGMLCCSAEVLRVTLKAKGKQEATEENLLVYNPSSTGCTIRNKWKDFKPKKKDTEPAHVPETA